MRLLHTSDWHIGKRFEETDMLSLQAEFCDWLVEVIKQEKIEAVLIAGDIFDRSNPKPEPVDLVDNVLHRISAAGAAIVAITGNHDSAERLNFGARFMTGGGLYIRTERQELHEVGSPVTLTSRSGDEVEILPLPYIDPQRVLVPEGSTRSHDSVLKTVIKSQLPLLKDPSRAIAMSHSFVNGGTSSDSERPLTIGGTGIVPASIFDGLGYVALGHLHRPQIIGDGNVIYSGSPMSYSFSEQHAKSVRVIDTANALASSELNVEVGRPVVTLQDTLKNLLESSEYEKHRSSFVRARLTDPNLQLGIMEKLRARFPHILIAEQISLQQQGSLTREQINRARVSPKELVDNYAKESIPDLDKFQQEFIHEAVATAVKGEAE